jgi:hypothetical protein
MMIDVTQVDNDPYFDVDVDISLSEVWSEDYWHYQTTFNRDTKEISRAWYLNPASGNGSYQVKESDVPPEVMAMCLTKKDEVTLIIATKRLKGEL